MALLKLGAIVTETSGSLAGHTIQNSYGGVQLRTKPIPHGNPSVSQSLIRSYNPVLQTGWRALTPSQQKIWNLWPATHGIFNAKGDMHPLSGHSLWMKYQFTRLFEGLPFLSHPSLHLPTYIGPELINQSTWFTNVYWAYRDSQWYQSGNTFVCIKVSGSAYASKFNFWTIGKTYRVNCSLTVNGGTNPSLYIYDNVNLGPKMQFTGNYSHFRTIEGTNLWLLASFCDLFLSALSIHEIYNY
ncbi:MAG: hypothetical protein A2Z74_07465 [Chloroflexi bacterium RBG_13_46_9]|nr:MAG: hypothetical protein A2Z74_07465 [Chloroflexi bacterium RBG_13_46_9]